MGNVVFPRYDHATTNNQMSVSWCVQTLQQGIDRGGLLWKFYCSVLVYFLLLDLIYTSYLQKLDSKNTEVNTTNSLHMHIIYWILCSFKKNDTLIFGHKVIERRLCIKKNLNARRNTSLSLFHCHTRCFVLRFCVFWVVSVVL